MKYYLLLSIFLLPILSFGQDAKNRHLELSLRVGTVQGGSFQDLSNNLTTLERLNKPQGSAYMTNELSAEIAVAKSARSFDKNTRWTYGLKFGVTPSKLAYFYSDSFYDNTLIPPSSIPFGDNIAKLKLGTQYYGGITGGFRTRLFRIKEAWFDWQVDVGITVASSQNVSSSYDPLFNIEGDINGSGNLFLDLRQGLRFNMPIKGRMIGISGTVAFSRHESYNYDITYFGDSETVSEQLRLRHVFPAFGLTYFLVKSSE